MKKVCVVTGSRADYGLLRYVMAGLRDSQYCALQVIATGMHLASEFGYTWRNIEADGFHIDWKVDMLLGADTEVAVTKSVGLAITGFADAFAALQPDLVLLLGIVSRFLLLRLVQRLRGSRLRISTGEKSPKGQWMTPFGTRLPRCPVCTLPLPRPTASVWFSWVSRRIRSGM